MLGDAEATHNPAVVGGRDIGDLLIIKTVDSADEESVDSGEVLSHFFILLFVRELLLLG